MAAKKVCPGAEPAIIRYGLADELDCAEMSKKFRKDIMRRLTKEEVREELEEKLMNLPPPVTVVFANQDTYHVI